MDIRKLQRTIVDGLEDVKAQHIAVFNTEHLSSLFERVIIASGSSNRQTKALAASVRESVKSRGMPVLSVEGEENGEWIIVDCGAAVVHIMQPAIREYYHLEEIWGGKTVRLKVGEINTRLVKASEPDPEPVLVAKPARKRAPVNKGVSKEAVEKKATNRTAAFKRVAAKSPARRTTGGGRESTAPATQTVVVKSKSAPKSVGKPSAKPAPKPAAKKAAPFAAPRVAPKAAPKAAPRAAPRAATKSAPKAPAKPAGKTVRKPARKTS